MKRRRLTLAMCDRLRDGGCPGVRSHTMTAASTRTEAR